MDDIILVCPPGADEYPISHGDQDYRPNAYRADHTDPASNWHVPVPRHVARALMHNAGFYMPEQIRVLNSAGSIEIMAADGGPFACSPHGWPIASHVRADGAHVAFCPVEFVADLRPHGFSPAPPMVEPAPKARAAKVKAPEPEAAVSEPAPAQEPAPPQTRDGGAKTAFPKDGEHPDGGPQAEPPKAPLAVAASGKLV